MRGRSLYLYTRTKLRAPLTFVFNHRAHALPHWKLGFHRFVFQPSSAPRCWRAMRRCLYSNGVITTFQTCQSIAKDPANQVPRQLRNGVSCVMVRSHDVLLHDMTVQSTVYYSIVRNQWTWRRSGAQHIPWGRDPPPSLGTRLYVRTTFDVHTYVRGDESLRTRLGTKYSIYSTKYTYLFLPIALSDRMRYSSKTKVSQ